MVRHGSFFCFFLFPPPGRGVWFVFWWLVIGYYCGFICVCVCGWIFGGGLRGRRAGRLRGGGGDFFDGKGLFVG